MAASPGLNGSREPADEIVREGLGLVAELDRNGVTARALGGVAVVLHCESLGGRAHRPIEDIDLVTRGRERKALEAVLAARGYEAATRFNAMNGDRRMMFAGPAGKLDIFVDEFEMCHRLDLRARLDLESPTLPATDLLLTKLQIVELNAKDAADIDVLFDNHEVGRGAGDRIDLDYLCELVADDWGLWRTVTGTLEEFASTHPQHAEKAALIGRELDATEKSRRFRMRARIGERKRWYELPEEVPG